MQQKKAVSKKEVQKLRNTFNRCKFTLRILTKIYSGYRPSEIAKQLSVNSYNNNQNIPNSLFYDAKVPVRLHNLSFVFKIISSLEHHKILWKNMKNGVSRHTVIRKNREEENTVDLVKTSF